MTELMHTIEEKLHFYMEEAQLVPLLKHSMEYTLFNAGKRIRPYVCLLVCQTAGGTAEVALPYACATELIHTYSLIHDDLPGMDNDELRRGKPSSHIAFGVGNAVLAGDALLSLAMQILSGAENRKAAAAVSSGALAMLNGQSLDINGGEMNEIRLREMYDGKTGGLFCSAVLSGAYAAGCDEKAVQAWKAFALRLGLLFQITDDFLDAEKDAAEGKVTYLQFHTKAEAEHACCTLTDELLSFLENYQNVASDTLVALIRSLAGRKA